MKNEEVGNKKSEVEKWRSEEGYVLRAIMALPIFASRDSVLRTINNENLELEISGAKL